MKSGRRVWSALVSLGFVLLLVLSLGFSSHVLHHHCGGEGCVVCHQLHHNRQQLTHTALQGSSGVTLPAPGLGETLYRASRGVETVASTLISLKVKLSN